MIKLMAILTLFASWLTADISWSKSYDAALLTATSENKNVMVVLAKENCQACEYMEEIVFKDSNIESNIQENFIPVLIDVKKEKVPSTLKYFGTPTFYFLTPSGKQIYRHDGAEKKEDFLEIIKQQIKINK